VGKRENSNKKENVWDILRPTICEPFNGSLMVVVSGKVIVKTDRGFRSLETSHPPIKYIPPDEINLDALLCNKRATLCEWKGKASYFNFKVSNRNITDIAWTYTYPTPRFRKIKNYLSFYASKVDARYVNGETVFAQNGDFYGGWIKKAWPCHLKEEKDRLISNTK